VTSICCVSNIIGVITGFLLPNMFVNSNMGNDEYKNNIEKYLYTEMIINGIFCLPLLLLMKSKPSIPPSNSQNNYKSPPIIECIKILFKNKSFILLLINFTFIMGYFNLYGTVSNSLYSMYKIDDNNISYIVGAANIAGIFSSLIVSSIVDKYKNYKQVFIILNITGIIFHGGCTLFIELFEEYAFIILMFCSCVCYCSILPIYTCSMDFVCELTYPVGETISGGIIMTFTQISGIIIVKNELY
jgi:predicted MFS family arabinose efflux permease